MTIFMEADDRREVIRSYGQGYSVLVETGTNDGATPAYLEGDFDRIWTIEMAPDLHAMAAKRFARSQVVRCLLGDSAKVLPKLLPKLDGPAVFWLDGHHSGPGTAHGDLSTPVRAELACVLADRFHHVVLIDDARIFAGEPEHEMYDHYADYPTLGWVESFAARHGYAYDLADDIVRLT